MDDPRISIEDDFQVKDDSQRLQELLSKYPIQRIVIMNTGQVIEIEN